MTNDLIIKKNCRLTCCWTKQAILRRHIEFREHLMGVFLTSYRLTERTFGRLINNEGAR